MENYEINPENIPPDLVADENITLWRYMSFGSLCEILMNNHIPLISIRNFSDKSEGVILKEVLSKLPNTYEESIEYAIQKYFEWVYISSWHKSENENAAMWDRYTYGGEGVAIKTNAKLLLDCIKAVKHNVIGGPEYAGTMNPESTPNEIKLNVGYVIKEIEYTERKPSEFEIREELLREGYDKMCFFYKMMDFKDEAEVRILYSTFIEPYKLSQDHPSDLPDIHSTFKTAPVKNSVHLRIDSADKFIQQIVISPYAHNQFVETVKQVVARINYCRRLQTPQSVAVGFDIVESKRKEWV